MIVAPVVLVEDEACVFKAPLATTPEKGKSRYPPSRLSWREKWANGGRVDTEALDDLTRWLTMHGGDGTVALWSTNHRTTAGSVTMTTRPPLAHFSCQMK